MSAGRYVPILALAEVEAERFDPTQKPWPVGVFAAGSYCTSLNDGEWCQHHELHHLKPKWRCVTSEGEQPIQPGDWIVTGKHGRQVVSADEFQKSYVAAAAPKESNAD